MEVTQVAIGVVIRDQKILVCRRKSTGILANYWEFPGGKRETGESITQCLSRELREELGILPEIAAPLTVIEHRYPQVHVLLHPFLCQLSPDQQPVPISCQELRWVSAADLATLEFPPANASLLTEIAQRMHSDHL